MTDDRSEDASYENEGGKVTITLKEYDKLREKQSYITDKQLISVIDKIEENADDAPKLPENNN